VPRLSAEGLRRLGAAHREAAALLALDQLRTLLDPAGVLERWAAAGAIEARLKRFEGGAWKLIRRGERAPQGPIEDALAALAASSLPRGRRRIFDLLS